MQNNIKREMKNVSSMNPMNATMICTYVEDADESLHHHKTNLHSSPLEAEHFNVGLPISQPDNPLYIASLNDEDR